MGLIHGQTAGQLLVPVLVDADGTLHVNLAAGAAVIHTIVDSGDLTALVSGKDSGATRRTLLVDASGAPIVAGQDAGAVDRILRTDTSGHLLVDGESPSIFRPTQQHQAYSNLNLPAGSSTQTICTVPASQAWRMTTFTFRYTGTVAGVNLRALIYDGATNYYFYAVYTVVSSVFYSIVVDMVLAAGWSVRADVIGATLNDDFYSYVFAERIY